MEPSTRPLVDISPATAVHRLVRHSAGKTALVYEGRSITYRQLVDAAARLAVVLREGGVGRGDRLTYLGLNSPAFLTTYLASCWLGAVFVPVNSRLAAAEVRPILADAGCKALVAEPGHRKIADAATEGTSMLRLLVDDDPADPALVPATGEWRGLSGALSAVRETFEPVACHDEDLAALVYTSGTTGRPKGVALTHGNFWWNNANMDASAGIRGDEVNLVVAPLFHTAPFGCFTLRNLMRGGTTVLRRGFEAGQALKDLVEYRVTTFFAVPAMYRSITLVPGFAEADLSALKVAVAAGAPTPAPLIAEYADRGIWLQQAYGLTEVLFATCLPPGRTREKIGSVGVAVPFTQVRVVEPGTEREVASPGTPGEVCIRGPTVTRGYWGNPQATAQALGSSGSWFRTGDVGHMDADGCLFIVDRLKDMIIVAGDNVYSSEVEHALVDLPGVAEVAVVGVPDETWGEAVAAVVVPVEGAVPPSLGGLRELAGARIARYKLPTRLVLTSALPRNAMGKLDKNAIRAALLPGAAGLPAATSVAPTPVTATPSAPPPPRAAVAAPEPGAAVKDAGTAPVPPATGAPAESEWAKRVAGMSEKVRHRHSLELVKAQIAGVATGLDAASLWEESRLLDLGLGSLAAVELCNRLSRETGLRLPTTLVFDHPTIGALADYLLSLLENGSSPVDAAAANSAQPSTEKIDSASDDELFRLIDQQVRSA
jgi:fatty-acyl-CoA synthase